MLLNHEMDRLVVGRDLRQTRGVTDDRAVPMSPAILFSDNVVSPMNVGKIDGLVLIMNFH